MFHPAAKLTVKKDRLHRKAVLDLAEYRHAWEYGESEQKQDELHEKACKSVAALRAYDVVVKDSRVISTDQFWTLAGRLAESHDFRAEMRFPSSGPRA